MNKARIVKSENSEYPYNVQILTSVDGKNWNCCGNGKFCKTLDEAEQLVIKFNGGITREEFENITSWKMSYEEFVKCDCTICDNKECIHRQAFRRVPRIDGGLGLCPNLKGGK